MYVKCMCVIGVSSLHDQRDQRVRLSAASSVRLTCACKRAGPTTASSLTQAQNPEIFEVVSYALLVASEFERFPGAASIRGGHLATLPFASASLRARLRCSAVHGSCSCSQNRCCFVFVVLVVRRASVLALALLASSLSAGVCCFRQVRPAHGGRVAGTLAALFLLRLLHLHSAEHPKRPARAASWLAVGVPPHP